MNLQSGIRNTKAVFVSLVTEAVKRLSTAAYYYRQEYIQYGTQVVLNNKCFSNFPSLNVVKPKHV